MTISKFMNTDQDLDWEKASDDQLRQQAGYLTSQVNPNTGTNFTPTEIANGAMEFGVSRENMTNAFSVSGGADYNNTINDAYSYPAPNTVSDSLKTYNSEDNHTYTDLLARNDPAADIVKEEPKSPTDYSNYFSLEDMQGLLADQQTALNTGFDTRLQQTKDDISGLSQPQAIIAPKYTAEEYQFNPDQLTSYQLQGLLAENGQYIQQARNQAMNEARRYGMTSSSMAVGAAQGAAIERAEIIANADALAAQEAEVQRVTGINTANADNAKAQLDAALATGQIEQQQYNTMVNNLFYNLEVQNQEVADQISQGTTAQTDLIKIDRAGQWDMSMSELGFGQNKTLTQMGFGHDFDMSTLGFDQSVKLSTLTHEQKVELQNTQINADKWEARLEDTFTRQMADMDQEYRYDELASEEKIQLIELFDNASQQYQIQAQDIASDPKMDDDAKIIALMRAENTYVGGAILAANMLGYEISFDDIDFMNGVTEIAKDLVAGVPAATPRYPRGTVGINPEAWAMGQSY